MRSIYIIVLWLASAVAAMDFLAEPGFEIGYAQVPSAAVSVAGVGGRMELGLFRLAYSGSYMAMDSIYRQVYSEWDALAAYLPEGNLGIVGGVGYGLSVEWVPQSSGYAGESWTSNRYRAGAAIVKGPLAFSAEGSLLSHRSYFELDYALALRFESNRFGAQVGYDGTSVDVVSLLKFAHVAICTGYRFPEFAVSASLALTFGDWTLAGAYAHARSIWDWFGFGLRKSVRKKTIL